MNTSPIRQAGGAGIVVLGILIVSGLLAAAWFAFFLHWNYSTGERAGWVQKLSKKGWLCKTWEGEMALVTMPGTAQEKFIFTVRDDAVANDINGLMGRRVTVHYEEKVGLPTSCFGETRHFVTRATAVPDIPLAPGIVVPVPTAPANTPGSPASALNSPANEATSPASAPAAPTSPASAPPSGPTAHMTPPAPASMPPSGPTGTR